jgi:hypothetical protein
MNTTTQTNTISWIFPDFLIVCPAVSDVKNFDQILGLGVLVVPVVLAIPDTRDMRY